MFPIMAKVFSGPVIPRLERQEQSLSSPKSLAQALLLRGVLAKGVSGTGTFSGRAGLLQKDKSMSLTWIKIRPDQTLSTLAQNFCLEAAEYAHSPQPGGNKLTALISSHQACFAGKSAPTCALTCRLTDLWQTRFFKILLQFQCMQQLSLANPESR